MRGRLQSMSIYLCMGVLMIQVVTLCICAHEGIAVGNANFQTKAGIEDTRSSYDIEKSKSGLVDGFGRCFTTFAFYQTY